MDELTRPTWDQYFLEIAKAVSLRADCTRAQHGAVIVDEHHRIVSTGYNGAPAKRAGCASDGACPRSKLSYDQLPSGSSYDTGPGACIAIHAEANAIIYGDATRYRHGIIYITGEPCGGCRKLIAGAGLATMVYPEPRLGGFHIETVYG